MAKKKAATKKENEPRQLNKAETIAIDLLSQAGMSSEEIARDTQLPIDLVQQYLGLQQTEQVQQEQIPEKPKQPGVILPFAVKKHGNSSVVQMTQAASEISDGVRNVPKPKRTDGCIYRPH